LDVDSAAVAPRDTFIGLKDWELGIGLGLSMLKGGRNSGSRSQGLMLASMLDFG
jgi:hypothetical protein